MQQLIATLETKSNAELAAQYNEAFAQLKNKGKFKAVNGRFADKKTAVARTATILIALDQEQPELDLDEPMLELTLKGDEIVEVKQAYDVKADETVEVEQASDETVEVKPASDVKPTRTVKFTESEKELHPQFNPDTARYSKKEFHKNGTGKVVPFREGTKYASVVEAALDKFVPISEAHKVMNSVGAKWSADLVRAAFIDNIHARGYTVEGKLIDDVFCVMVSTDGR